MRVQVGRPIRELELPVVNSPNRFWAGFPSDLREMFSQRDLLRALIARELRKKYKGSRLGWLWATARPLMMLAVFAVAVGWFLGAGRLIPDFAVYVFIGIMSWTLFSNLISGSISIVIDNAQLIRKSPFRKELLILSVLVAAFVDLAIQGIVLFVGIAIFGTWPSVGMLWWVVPSLVLVTVFGLVFGLLLSAANVYYRDVGFLTDVILQVGFWLTPVVYSYAMVRDALASWPALLDLYSLSPPTVALNGLRLALWAPASGEQGASVLMSASQTGVLLSGLLIIGVVLLVLSQRVFSRTAASMAQLL